MDRTTAEFIAQVAAAPRRPLTNLHIHWLRPLFAGDLRVLWAPPGIWGTP